MSVLTNTPPRVSQSQPGGMQGIAIMEPVLAKAGAAARDRSGGDPPPQLAGRKGAVRAARTRRDRRLRHERVRQERRSTRAPSSSDGTSARRRAGSARTKVRGVGVGMSTFFAGSNGFDGLIIIKPDGRLYMQSGIGNLGTESVIDSIASRPRSSACPGTRSRSPGATRASTCRGPALGRQPDDPRDDARRARGGHGREEEAAGDRRKDARRRAGGLPGGRRARVQAAAAA